MKVQIALLITLVAFAIALPVPDEEVQSEPANVIVEKKENAAEDIAKTVVIEEKEDEVKLTEAAAPVQAEAKSVPVEEVKQAVVPEVKEETPAERKLDVIPEDSHVVPAESVAAVESKPAPPEEKSLQEKSTQPEVRSSENKDIPAAGEKADKPEEPQSNTEVISETKEIREEKPAEPKIEETKPEETKAEAKKSEEVKLEERQIRGDDDKKEVEATAAPAAVEPVAEIKSEPKTIVDEPKKEENENELLRELPVAQTSEVVEQPKERAAAPPAADSEESKESVEKIEKPRQESSEESTEEKSE